MKRKTWTILFISLALCIALSACVPIQTTQTAAHLSPSPTATHAPPDARTAPASPSPAPTSAPTASAPTAALPFRPEDFSGVLGGETVSVRRLCELLGEPQQLDLNYSPAEGAMEIELTFRELEIVLNTRAVRAWPFSFPAPDVDKEYELENAQLSAQDREAELSIDGIYWHSAQACALLPPPRGTRIGDEEEAVIQKFPDHSTAGETRRLYGLSDLLPGATDAPGKDIGGWREPYTETNEYDSIVRYSYLPGGDSAGNEAIYLSYFCEKGKVANISLFYMNDGE